jgi:hypothetical protein
VLHYDLQISLRRSHFGSESLNYSAECTCAEDNTLSSQSFTCTRCLTHNKNLSYVGPELPHVRHIRIRDAKQSKQAGKEKIGPVTPRIAGNYSRMSWQVGSPITNRLLHFLKLYTNQDVNYMMEGRVPGFFRSAHILMVLTTILETRTQFVLLFSFLVTDSRGFAFSRVDLTAQMTSLETRQLLLWYSCRNLQQECSTECCLPHQESGVGNYPYFMCSKVFIVVRRWYGCEL